MTKASSEIPPDRPVIVQHSFGDLGSGGPIGALTRVMASPLSQKYELVRLHQDRATGGIDLPRLRRWRDELRDIQPDLVHVRGLGNEGFHGVLAARAAGCPRILVSVHGSIRDVTTKRRIKDHVLINVAEPMTLRLATHVTTVCEFAARRPFMQAHRAKFVGPITNGVELVAPNGTLRATARNNLGLSQSAVVLISVGRLTREKGHADLATALGLVRSILPSETVLLVIGDGPDRGEIEKMYAATGVDVRVIGRRSDVPELLVGGDVFVFPTLHENLSNALLEAMAAGLPVVATTVGGNVEVVEKGGGLLVSPGRPRALADAVQRLVTDLELRQSLGHQARAVVERHYSVAAMCASLDRVYCAILENSK